MGNCNFYFCASKVLAFRLLVSCIFIFVGQIVHCGEEFYPFTKYVMVSKPAEAESKEKQVGEMPVKLSKKKSLKMKDKTVCMGDDGTIFFPFN